MFWSQTMEFHRICEDALATDIRKKWLIYYLSDLDVAGLPFSVVWPAAGYNSVRMW